MPLKTILINIICLFVFMPLLWAKDSEQFMFKRIDVEKGFANSEIRCIYKNSVGYMWFGTRYGLCRYDGYNVISYKQDLMANGVYQNNDIALIQEDAENRLWLETRTGYNIFDPLKEEFISNSSEEIKKYALTDSILYMYIDLGKNMWFVTNDDIRFFNIKTSKTNIYKLGDTGRPQKGRIAAICQGENKYWFLHTNGLVECMDAQTHTITMKDSTLVFNSPDFYDGQSRLFSDSKGNLWIYGLMEKGASCLNTNKNTWEHFSKSQEDVRHRLPANIVTGITEDKQGRIWISMDHGGIVLLDKENNIISEIRHDRRNVNSLAQDAVKSIYIDNEDIVWAGTYKRGVCYYHSSIFKFHTVKNHESDKEMDVNCFLETKDGKIWIGSNGNGLLCYDRDTEKFISYKHDPRKTNTPAGDVIVSIVQDYKDRLWIGYYMNGMDCWDGKKFTHYDFIPNEECLLPDKNVWKLLCDDKKRLWIGTLNSGIVTLDLETGKKLKHFPSISSVFSIIQRADGSILVGALNGLFIFDEDSKTIKEYEPEIFGKAQLSRHDINYLFEDSRKLLWIGTRNGLFIFNPITKELRLFTVDDGLSADLIQSILEDAEHNIWIATNRGLTLIKVNTQNDTPGYFFKMLNYDQAEGLQGEQFNYNGALATSHSELIFGGSLGFNIVNPSAIHYNNNNPKVILTKLKIYDKTITPGMKYNGKSILDKSISYTKSIELGHSENYFTLEFAALDYCVPDKSRYFYKLEGLNDLWIETNPNTREVTYTNLNPGKYTFHVKAINSDGMESIEPASLEIIINPPFWKSNLAWGIYLIILLSLLYIYHRYSKKKEEKKIIYTREKMKIENQHNMDEMKLRFFTNISHEFRTPLTLIITPLEELIKKSEKAEDKELLRIIHKNAQQLLNLVNQLLDFRKMDVNGLKLNLQIGNITLFVKDTVFLFKEAFAHKNIEFSIDGTDEAIFMRFDGEKIGKVLNNLLSNSYKFTPQNGKINVCIERDDANHEIRISVSDSGIGIQKDERDKVFNRFYQVNHKYYDANGLSGSGIGLHLSKEYIELHKGKIWVEDSQFGGCKMVFSLPLPDEGEEALIEELENSRNNEDEDIKEYKEISNSNMPKLLIVDDNNDFRTFLCTCMQNRFEVIQAENGEKAFEIAVNEIPDMIISDVMMPVMDGIQLCKMLKNDVRTSHIPLILLTAKATEESQIDGLKSGADDYISKPFNIDVLYIKMKNLIESRKKMQSMLKEPIPIEPSRITVNNIDEELIRKALEYTEANISNPDFSVEELSKELGMSRVHLYKKLLSLTGKTPIEFIRLVRLKRAAQLLKESKMNVSEIAYEVGFNHPKYFRKYFKEEFGVLPSQFEKS